jgi:hypothetical protein
VAPAKPEKGKQPGQLIDPERVSPAKPAQPEKPEELPERVAPAKPEKRKHPGQYEKKEGIPAENSNVQQDEPENEDEEQQHRTWQALLTKYS